MAVHLSSALIVARHVKAGAQDFQVLLMQRSAKSKAFAAFHVFPGGLVDAEDSSAQWAPILGQKQLTDDTIYRLAAIREIYEEAGLIIHPKGPAPDRAMQKRVFETPAFFREIATKHTDIAAAVGSLKPVAQFITPTHEKRRFNTFFFAAPQLVEGEATHDGDEAVSLNWYSPAEALRLCGRGEFPLMPPQWYILKKMSSYSKWADFIASLPLHAGPMQPYFAVSDDMLTLTLPGDEAYPQPGALGARHRLTVKGFKGSFADAGMHITLQHNTGPKL